MNIRVLNLTRRPDRWTRFQMLNSHLSGAERVECIDGPALGVEGLREHGVDRESLPKYQCSTIGNQLTHMREWKRIAASQEAGTVAEDDAIFHRDFEGHARELLTLVPDDYDVIFWGWTQCCAVMFEIAPGCRWILGATSKEVMPGENHRFPKHPYVPNLHRVSHCYNSFAYTLSPRGARNLLEKCWPLKDETLPMTGTGTQVDIYGVDAKVSATIPFMQAYLCFPPIVYHPHDISDSDMVPDGAFAEHGVLQ
jgi:GR25 family glycosyltransferase involved in LPS biosynthesis